MWFSGITDEKGLARPDAGEEAKQRAKRVRNKTDNRAHAHYGGAGLFIIRCHGLTARDRWYAKGLSHWDSLPNTFVRGSLFKSMDLQYSS